MRVLWLLRFAALLVVAGCALSPEYRARYEARVAAQQQAIDQADDAHCRSLGTAPSSTAYVYCREATARNRQAADEAQRQAWAGVAQSGFQMMATSPPAPQPPPPAGDPVCVSPTDNSRLYRC